MRSFSTFLRIGPVTHSLQVTRGRDKFWSASFVVVIALSTFSTGQSEIYPHNAVACERCHNVPQKFGGSSMLAQRVGSKTQNGFIPVAEGGIRHRFGESLENTTPSKQITGNRVSLNLLGDGLIEVISDKDIDGNEEYQRRTQEGLLGVTVSAPVLEASGTSLVTGMEVRLEKSTQQPAVLVRRFPSQRTWYTQPSLSGRISCPRKYGQPYRIRYS